MIAIYDQHGIREIISIWPEPKKKSKLRANVRYFHADADTIYVETFDFNTEPQAQYVLDQIALAVERGDKLFRMPSAEEVKKKLEKKQTIKLEELTEDEERKREEKCRECLYAKMPDEELASFEKDPCESCFSLSGWQPKE